MELPDIDLVLGALDSLGVALADHDHQWTEGERAIYERAVEIVTATPRGERSEKLKEAAQEALVAIATFKITDSEKPYTEISPSFRAQLLKAHDLLLDALQDHKYRVNTGDG